MPLVKNAEIVPDSYVTVADDAELPSDGAVLISSKRFLDHAEALAQRNSPVGVIWPNNRDVAELAPWLDRLALVALVFPTFRDGRAHSQARLLRERFNFKGELRATGQVLRDQFTFLLRNGFDSFDARKPGDAEAFTITAKRYSVFYQPTGDGRLTALQQRLKLRQTEGVRP